MKDMKNNKIRYLLMLIVIVFCLVLVGCGGNKEATEVYKPIYGFKFPSWDFLVWPMAALMYGIGNVNVCMPKNSVDIANMIGTYETSIKPYEDCCTVFLPENPVVRPDLQKTIKQQQRIDFDAIIERAMQTLETVEIKAD